MGQFIDQDPVSEELTTERGCFNCGRFNSCRLRDRKVTDYTEVLIHPSGKPYVYGCACSGYVIDFEKKEQVEFT
jgi:hypothetical protein